MDLLGRLCGGPDQPGDRLAAIGDEDFFAPGNAGEELREGGLGLQAGDGGHLLVSLVIVVSVCSVDDQAALGNAGDVSVNLPNALNLIVRMSGVRRLPLMVQ